MKKLPIVEFNKLAANKKVFINQESENGVKYRGRYWTELTQREQLKKAERVSFYEEDTALYIISISVL